MWRVRGLGLEWLREWGRRLGRENPKRWHWLLSRSWLGLGWPSKSRLGGSLLGALGFSFRDMERESIGEDLLLRAEEMGREPVNGWRLEAGPAFPAPWEIIIQSPHFSMWQRRRPDGLLEYFCSGSYSDITANSFYVAQMDLDYRREWDAYALAIDVRRDLEERKELVRWVTKCPFPLYPREYLFFRTWSYSSRRQIFVSQSCLHPDFPEDSASVRVPTYRVAMIIRPHEAPDKPGLDFSMVYLAGDQVNGIPSIATKWMVQYGIPGFLQNVADAAAKLSSKRLNEKLSLYSRLPNVHETDNLLKPYAGPDSSIPQPEETHVSHDTEEQDENCHIFWPPPEGGVPGPW